MVEYAILSDKRKKSLVEEIITQDATFLGLNEVTDQALSEILENDWIKKTYYVSKVPTDQGDAGAESYLLDPHGCVLFSKIPFLSATTISYMENNREVQRKSIIGFFRLSLNEDVSKSVLFAVASVHTHSQQTPKRKFFREAQLRALSDDCIELLNQHSIDADERKGFVMMGDMNLHYLAEDGIVNKCGTVDAYAETHFGESQDNDPGYTFNAETNIMMKRYIPGEYRKMRLDRILVSLNSPVEFMSPCSLWATEPVSETLELSISDHYGLSIDMKFDLDHSLTSDPQVEKRLQDNASLELEPFHYGTAKMIRYMVPHTFWLIQRAVGFR